MLEKLLGYIHSVITYRAIINRVIAQCDPLYKYPDPSLGIANI
jgi:hypothetical protein